MITEQELLDNDFYPFGIDEWIGVKYFEKKNSPFTYQIALYKGKAKSFTFIYEEADELFEGIFFTCHYDNDKEFNSIDEIMKDWASIYKENNFYIFGDIPFSFENIPEEIYNILN